MGLMLSRERTKEGKRCITWESPAVTGKLVTHAPTRGSSPPRMRTWVLSSASFSTALMT